MRRGCDNRTESLGSLVLDWLGIGGAREFLHRTSCGENVTLCRFRFV